MSNLYSLILMILERPELYIGKQSIQRLYSFLSGYLHQNKSVDDHCLDGFNEYIANYYNIHSDHNWADIIQFFSTSGFEEIALFKKHFDAFTAAQKQKTDSLE